MPYGYASDVVRDGQLVAQVRTWMVCYSCGHEQPRTRLSAHCVEKRTNCTHIYLSQPGTLTPFPVRASSAEWECRTS